MSRIFGSDSILFERYVAGRNRVIFPWPLSIVDCFNLVTAFRLMAGGTSALKLSRLVDYETPVEKVSVADAFDLHDVDAESAGFEVVLLHAESGALVYWDVHERFVLGIGDDRFLSTARPYPADIEKHRYIDEMIYPETVREEPEMLYEKLARIEVREGPGL